MSKRHEALNPLSHDHHHALAAATRLFAAARSGDAATMEAAAKDFLWLLWRETVAHFRYEEEAIFPLFEAGDEEHRELVSHTLLDHVALHRSARALERGLLAGDIPSDMLEAAGNLLRDHVRFEEKVLFPAIEAHAGEDELAALPPVRHGAGLHDRTEAVDLRSGRGTGPVWTRSTQDLNVNLIDRAPGETVGSHVNRSHDVVLVGISGNGSVWIDETEHPVSEEVLVIIRKGTSRRISAGPRGFRYLTVHGPVEALRIRPSIGPSR